MPGVHTYLFTLSTHHALCMSKCHYAYAPDMKDAGRSSGSPAKYTVDPHGVQVRVLPRTLLSLWRITGKYECAAVQSMCSNAALRVYAAYYVQVIQPTHG
jgi:hypothetical protein